MGLELDGVLIKKGEAQQVSASFRKLEFVIETEENYPQKVAFELTQDRCGEIDRHQVGDKLKVHFNVRGREWNGKYFTNLQAWRIENLSAGQGGGGQHSAAPVGNFPPPVEPPKDSDDDDLPF